MRWDLQKAGGRIDGRREVGLAGGGLVDSQTLWEIGRWPCKQVAVMRLTRKTGGRWEVETLDTPLTRNK